MFKVAHILYSTSLMRNSNPLALFYSVSWETKQNQTKHVHIFNFRFFLFTCL